MGKNPLWEYLDACTLLASFEMEVAKEFGETDELYSFRRLVSRKVMSNLEKSFHDKWGKWSEWLDKQLNSFIPFANVLGREDEPIDDSDGSKTIVYSKASFTSKDLVQCLIDDASKNDISLDIVLLHDFLIGNATAPPRYFQSVEKEVVKEVEKIIEVEVLPKVYFKNQADKSHASGNLKTDAFWKFLLDDLSGECTCTKKQASERLYKDKYLEDVKYLKRETGYKYLMMTRKVSKAIKEIEKDKSSGFNRHENTKGFSHSKIPTCKKHKSK
jgi:hypothetical protein